MQQIVFIFWLLSLNNYKPNLIIMKIFAALQILSEIEDEELQINTETTNEVNDDGNIISNETVDPGLLTGNCSFVLTIFTQR